MAIYVQKQASSLDFSVQPIPELTRKELEALWLQIECPPVSFIFVVIYRPSTSSTAVHQTDEALFEILRTTSELSKTVVITGDLNFSGISWPR